MDKVKLSAAHSYIELSLMASHKVAFSCIYSHHTHIMQSGRYIHIYVELYSSIELYVYICSMYM